MFDAIKSQTEAITPDWIANIYITWTLAGREGRILALCGYHWIIFNVFICVCVCVKSIFLSKKHIKFEQKQKLLFKLKWSF